jgi:Na+/proline symporter
MAMTGTMKDDMARLLGAGFTWLVIFFLQIIIVWLGWNTIVPTLFGLSKISYPQAMVLFILCNTLFKDGTRPMGSKKGSD